MAYVYAFSTAGPVGTDLVKDGAAEIREGVKAALNERILSVFANIDNDPWQFKDITLAANNTYDIGTTASRVKAAYINGLAVNLAVAPDAGSVLLANSTGALKARNFVGSANLTMMHMSTGDVLQLYNGAATLTAAGVFGAASATLTSGLTVTGATITGLTAASVATGTFPGVYTVTGALTLSAALTYGGITLSNAVTGTGNMVLSASPTFTGTITAAIANFSGLVTASGSATALKASPTNGAGNVFLQMTSADASPYGRFEIQASTLGLVVNVATFAITATTTTMSGALTLSGALTVPTSQYIKFGSTNVLYSDATLTVVAAPTSGSLALRVAGATDAITITGSNVAFAGALTGITTLAASGLISANAGIAITGGSFGANRIYSDATTGLQITGRTGSVYDFQLLGPGGSPFLSVPTGTLNVNLNGSLAITGALTGVTTLATSSTINSQTISATAAFTGTMTIATSLVVGTDPTGTGVLHAPSARFGGNTRSMLVSDDGTNIAFTKTSTGGYTFDANLTAVAFFTSSQRALKHNIRPFAGSALAIVRNTDIYGYAYNSDPTMPRVGWMADTTHEILAGRKHDRMDIPNAVGVLMKAVQELAVENEVLRARLD